MTSFPLRKITFETAIYPRVLEKKTGLPDWRRIQTYANKMGMGEVFPPIILASLHGKNLLIDGATRYFAARQSGFKEIEAEFIKCKNYDEARVESLHRNSANAHPLSQYELTEGAAKLLASGHKIKEISTIVRVSVPTLTDWLGVRVNWKHAGKAIGLREARQKIEAGQRVTWISKKNTVKNAGPDITREEQSIYTGDGVVHLLSQVIQLFETNQIDLLDKNVARAVVKLAKILARVVGGQT